VAIVTAENVFYEEPAAVSASKPDRLMSSRSLAARSGGARKPWSRKQFSVFSVQFLKFHSADEEPFVDTRQTALGELQPK
jgi:hypothetical protein